MYFWEFNEKEKEYREVKNKYGWIKEQGSNPGMIKKINENGKIFTNRERPDMLSNLIVNPLKEINSIVHFSQEYVFFAVTSKDTEKYILGPKKIDEDLMCGLIRSILESSILSMMVMEKAVKCHDSSFVNKAKDIMDYSCKLRKRSIEENQGGKENPC
jgi:hypothetical protein